LPFGVFGEGLKDLILMRSLINPELLQERMVVNERLEKD
jgi:hypothetical protein